jgi:hypothetical protein
VSHGVWKQRPRCEPTPPGLVFVQYLLLSGLGVLLVLAGSDVEVLLVIVLSGPEVLLDLEQKEPASASAKQLDLLLLAYVELREFLSKRLVSNQQGVRNLLVPS